MVEEDLKTLLGPLVAQRFYPHTAPQNPTFPCIVYFVVTRERIFGLETHHGLFKSRFQFDLYARTYSEVKTLEQNVYSSMAGWAIANVPGVSQDIYEDEIQLFRVLMEFSIHHA